MKRRYYISFNVGRENYSSTLELLRAIGCENGLAGPEKFLCGLYGRMFDGDDPRLERLRNFLRGAGITWTERCDAVYTEAELRAAPLLWLSVERNPIGMCAPDGAEYDLSTGCAVCASGARQVGPLKLRRSELPRTGLICQTADHVYLVARPVADMLRKEGVSGLELREVVSQRDGQALGWFQLIALNRMPALSPRSEGVTRSKGPAVVRREDPPPTVLIHQDCQRCGRLRGMELFDPVVLAYERHAIEAASLADVACTWEYFGDMIRGEDGRIMVLATPLILVRPRVYELFRRLKVRHAIFQPVQIIEG